MYCYVAKFHIDWIESVVVMQKPLFWGSYVPTVLASVDMSVKIIIIFFHLFYTRRANNKGSTTKKFDSIRKQQHKGIYMWTTANDPVCI